MKSGSVLEASMPICKYPSVLCTLPISSDVPQHLIVTITGGLSNNAVPTRDTTRFHTKADRNGTNGKWNELE